MPDPTLPDTLQPMGINGATGKPLHDPVDTEVLGEWIVRTLGGVRRAEPQAMPMELMEAKGGLPDGVLPSDVASAGWAVLWGPNTDATVKDALKPLLDERSAVAGPLFREIELQMDGGGQLESVGTFLERHGVSPGTITPAKLPYYLMIVGEPGAVPYDFQTGLSVDYAVGRLSLGDAAAYERYANAVLNVERSLIFTQGLGFFGPTNGGDPSTSMSAKQLIAPLAMGVNAGGWVIQSHTGSAATKQCLTKLLYGNDRVPVVFSASHGLGYDLSHPNQMAGQGAIRCENNEDFSAADLAQAGDLGGLIWFAFACFGAGTPMMDNFPGNPDLLKTTQIAPNEFQSALATALLSHERGPALGFLGHVDLAWSTSFKFGIAESQTADFKECLERVLKGQPLGHALRVLGERYASYSTLFSVELVRALQQGTKLRRGTATLLARYWTAAMDARNYVLCGDPASRIRH